MTIGEMTAVTGISADTLRYYERIGLIPHVPRTTSGIRNYNEEFIQWLAFIQQLKNIGMSLESIIEYIELTRQGRSTYEARKQILADTREQLKHKIHQLQQSMQQADYQLEHFDSTLFPVTDGLMNLLSA
jgi:DNA-binding transcriptional MerR regulator